MPQKLSADIIKFLEKTSTQDFLKAARQFMALLEDKDSNIRTFYSKAHTALLVLYLAGHKLDIIDLKYSSAENNFKNAAFENKNAGLVSGLGIEAYYWEVFDPAYSESNGQPNGGWTITDKEASQGWLVDDFADIYRDIKVELSKIDLVGTDEAVEDGLWQLKWGFNHHWGKHSINALRYLHYLYYEGKRTL